jgi:beta-lactamase regulating signal transducer with metallopeptidase domain
VNEILLNSLWQGAGVTAIAAVIALLVPQRQAATRHAVWLCALLGLVAVPLALLWHPHESVPVLPAQVVHTASAATGVTQRAASASGQWLLLLWTAGVAFCLMRLALSYAAIERIARRSEPAPHLGPNVVISPDVGTPIAARIFAPIVVIPLGVACSLDASDLQSIVQHELAHIRRMDLAVNLVQRIIEALFFFNPWVYVIGRQLVKEREAACDDWVVQAASDPDRYASCLAKLAQRNAPRGLPLLTPSAIPSKHMLVGRIARILTGKAPQLKINYAVIALTVVAFSGLGILLSTSQSVAATGVSLGAPSTVATASCTFPHGYSDVKPLNPNPPDIPKASYKAGVSAEALVTVNPDGHAATAKIVKTSGVPAIDQATIDAAMHSTYSPATKACKAVTGDYLFKVETGP